ncbi:thiamine phosphate synthase [Psychrobacter sp. I-STPA6b]|uniref:thiamine phosphate synthase n=1 Tax=Psychrobacter sp. I-STPA6b TaxID=2585718 RepID=UPI001D0C5460|nr:thiamine phosphate synthase [Psychrobacter sp. I-STPA6b]
MKTPSLYLITNDDELTVLCEKLDKAFATGVVEVVQIRRKKVSQAQGRAGVLHESKQIITLAERYGVTVVMNDDMQLAHELGVGVHLGQEDGNVASARQLLGDNALIGCTCHGSVALVEEAKRQGASYTALGAIFASSTKPSAQTISLSVLEQVQHCDIDLCVIGGISAENVTQLYPYSLRYVAVVGDILQYPVAEIALRCQRWQDALAGWMQ